MCKGKGKVCFAFARSRVPVKEESHTGSSACKAEAKFSVVVESDDIVEVRTFHTVNEGSKGYDYTLFSYKKHEAEISKN